MGAHAVVKRGLEPEDLAGSELAGVAFVRDYVELLFDGPIVRCFAGPDVEREGHTSRFPDPGSRDALCDLIGGTVLAVRVGEHQLSIDLDGERRVHVDFRREWAEGREAAQFVPFVDGRLAVEETLAW